MSNLLHLGATILCPHGGQAMPGGSSARVSFSGQPAISVAHMLSVAGCPFSTPDGPKPCTQVQWIVPAARVTIEGSPAILSSSTGLCIGAAGPAGPPQVVAQQPRVRGQ